MLRLKPIKEETMNKRIISLLLCAIMVLSVILTGCSKKTDDEAIADVNETASESTMTLTMYLMAESEVDADQVAKIEEAVNKITKSKFKTRLVLRYFTEEEYTEALEEAIKKTKEEKNSKKPGSKPAATTTTTAEETVINELGTTLSVRPLMVLPLVWCSVCWPPAMPVLTPAMCGLLCWAMRWPLPFLVGFPPCWAVRLPASSMPRLFASVCAMPTA